MVEVVEPNYIRVFRLERQLDHIEQLVACNSEKNHQLEIIQHFGLGTEYEINVIFDNYPKPLP